MNSLKKVVPNVLTSLRIINIPVIISLLLTNYTLIAIILTIITAITDMFDGYLARKWKTTSSFGAKLDTIADKLFVGCLLLILIPTYPILAINLFLEISIVGINLYSISKNNNANTKLIGKIKTVFIFITICLGIFSTLITNLEYMVLILNAFTISFQLICVLSYYKLYKCNELNKTA